jgi:hypothetical protein
MADSHPKQHVTVSTEDIEVGDRVALVGPSVDPQTADYREILKIEDEGSVRVLHLDGDPIVHASRTDNTIRVRRYGQVVYREEV